MFAAHYSGRVYPGVKVGALDLGGLSRNQASVVLRKQISAYRINLQIDSKKYEVHPSEIGASYQLDPTLDAVMNYGRNDLLPLVNLLARRNVEPLSFAYSLDKTKLRNYVERIITEQAEAPVDATVVINDGTPAVKPDQPGLGVPKTELESLLQQGVTVQADILQVRRQPIAADVKAAVADLSAYQAKQMINTPVTIQYGDKKFAPSTTDIAGWLLFTKNEDATLTAGLDGEKVKTYVAGIAKQIDIPAVAKQVNVVNGEVRSQEGGTDGLAVDQNALVKQLTDAIQSKQPATLSVPTGKVAYKTIYNRTYELNSGKYVEINLATQRMWAYLDHKVVYESPITSGATGYGFATVEGLFHIQAKQTNRYLDGRQLQFGYYVHVDYWMPFYGDYGLHDASWRSAFGGQDYYWGGSHGCVNLPLTTAAWLYGFVDVGTPVWVHQ